MGTAEPGRFATLGDAVSPPSPRRQERVNGLVAGVKEASGKPRTAELGVHAPCAAAVGVARSPSGEGASQMADLAYALLLIGVFALTALALRGLERL
ncbi:hypothetical protein [Umezawaea sp. Da 62-37]|uniref:hypothetical protein n=1 Tax=Umezawaea sp. Da 62-37 TaxID=3075927 RepID=UPI0028F73955|nr:hypothetical protein [Umezawaea sp. Da 62-37]WNV86052.1 hypothetical protein RM788_49400 [Umezawaea sp. Da 62-37]